MAKEKSKLKQEWVEKYGKFFGEENSSCLFDDYVEQGALIGFPLSELLVTTINDKFSSLHKGYEGYPYAFGQEKADVCIPHDYILILQYLGDAKFLELISGKVIINNGITIKDLYNDTYNLEAFQRELDYYYKFPIDCSSIEEYGLPVSDDLKVQYANTSLNNQEYIEDILEKLELEGRITIDDELGKMAASSQDEAESLLKAEEFIKRRIR